MSLALITILLSSASLSSAFRRSSDSKSIGEEAIKFAAACSTEYDRIYFHDVILGPFLRPRVSDTEGNRQVREHIMSQMTSLGWSVNEDSFDSMTPLGVKRFSNVVAVLNPNATTRLTLACHYDSKYFANETFIGAIDSAVSCAMLINLATCLNESLQELPKDQSMKTLQFIFFDGEEAFVSWSEEDSLYGSRHLAAEMEKQLVPGDDTTENYTNESDDDNDINRVEDVDVGFNVHRPVTLLDAIEALVVLDLIGTKQTHFFNWFPQASHLYSKMAFIENILSDSGVLESSVDATPRYDGQQYFLMPDHVIWPTHADIQACLRFFCPQDDHVPFMIRGVPVVHLISYPFPVVWHELDDDETALDYPTIENISTILRVFIADHLQLTA